MTTLLYKIGAAAVVAALLYGSGYLQGRNDGRVSQLRDSVAAYEKRKAIDGDVQDLGSHDLCLELGGLPVECNELRGVGAAPEGELASPPRG